MSQTRQGSVVEALSNIAVGYGINYSANLLILPLFGFTELNWKNNLLIGAIYTGISLCRQYIIRRYFNGLKFWEAKEAKGTGRRGKRRPARRG